MQSESDCNLTQLSVRDPVVAAGIPTIRGHLAAVTTVYALLQE